MTFRSILPVVTLIVVVLSGAASGRDPGRVLSWDARGWLAQAGASVRVVNGAYDPAQLSVRVGTVVTWTNTDNRDYTVVADNGAFDLYLRPGGSGTWRADRPGTYAYGCRLRPRTRGVIVVE